MADPHTITPDALEILVARDLRKAGLEIGALRRRDLSRGEDDPGEYRLALTTGITTPGSPRLLIVCRCVREPVGAEAVSGLAEGLARARGRGAARGDRPGAGAAGEEKRGAEEPYGEGSDGDRPDGDRPAGDRPAGGILVATDFAPEALKRAEDTGIALLRIADARASFDASGWGPRGHYPMWLPEYVLELATRDAAGLPSHEMLTQGHAERLLAAMGL